MKHSSTADIDYYRVQQRWNRAGHRRTIGLPYRGKLRRVPTRPWRRTHQAEWDGCQRAPRAFTRWGIRRKALPHCQPSFWPAAGPPWLPIEPAIMEAGIP